MIIQIDELWEPVRVIRTSSLIGIAEPSDEVCSVSTTGFTIDKATAGDVERGGGVGIEAGGVNVEGCAVEVEAGEEVVFLLFLINSKIPESLAVIPMSHSHPQPLTMQDCTSHGQKNPSMP